MMTIKEAIDVTSRTNSMATKTVGEVETHESFVDKAKAWFRKVTRQKVLVPVVGVMVVLAIASFLIPKLGAVMFYPGEKVMAYAIQGSRLKMLAASLGLTVGRSAVWHFASWAANFVVWMTGTLVTLTTVSHFV